MADQTQQIAGAIWSRYRLELGTTSATGVKEQADAAETSGRDANARDFGTSGKDPQRYVSAVQAQVSPFDSGSLGIGSLPLRLAAVGWSTGPDRTTEHIRP